MSQPAIDPPEGVKSNLENPTDVLRTINYVTQALTLVFCSFFVFSRVLQKFRLPVRDFSIDDYLTIVSWVLMVGYCVCGIFLSIHGGGYHMWEVPSGEVVQYLKAAYAATIFYAPMTLCIKLSLLTLIARVFSPYKRRVQGIYAFGGILVMYYLTSLALKIRICWPVSAYWHMRMDECLDQSAVILADSIISTITDAVILILPLPLMWSLQIQRNKKLRISSMLAVGGLATAFSAWRLHLILTDGDSPDATMLFVQVVLSGNAEAGIALICTCLPAFIGQLKSIKGRVRYGSSKSRDTASGTGKLGTFKSAHRGISNPSSLDELELVPHAQGQGFTHTQGNASPERGAVTGIVRRLEVTHTFSYAVGDSDRSGEDESK